MKVTTISADTCEIILEEEYLSRRPASGLLERSVCLDNPFITGLLREISAKDLTIQYGECRVHKALTISSSYSRPTLTLYFNLKNAINGRELDHSESFNVNGNEFCLVFNDRGTQTITIDSGQSLRYLTINILPDFVVGNSGQDPITPESIFSALDLSLPLRRKLTGAINKDMKSAIAQMIDNSARGIAKMLFIRSKVMELLSLQLQEIEELRKKTEKHFINSEDLEKLYQARELLKTRIADPPTIKELSRLCSINEFKLKKGFREVFSNTVYGVLFDFRMTVARQLLQETSHSISEIAEQVGYHYSHHFSKAFRKKYNVNPRELRNNQRTGAS